MVTVLGTFNEGATPTQAIIVRERASAAKKSFPVMGHDVREKRGAISDPALMGR